MSNENKLLQFIPFESCVEPTFWHKFTKIKLDIDMLQEKVRSIWGHYSPQHHRLLNVDCTSFNKEFNYITNSWKACGYHLNINTMDGFKSCDKTNLLQEYGKKLKENILSGQAIDCPSVLATFFLITYADLKKYHFYYWFAFPATIKPQYMIMELPCDLSTCFTVEVVDLLFQSHGHLPLDQQGFFGIHIKSGAVSTFALKEFLNFIEDGNKADIYWGFIDPCEDKIHPGWPLRNFLYLIFISCPALRNKILSIVCLRKKNNSILLQVKFNESDVADEDKWTGWEMNARSKFGPRFADLSSIMDPTKLAIESVDLNLRLMKWRLVPDLDLSCIKATSCLLLGAGTLGCSVARCLLAWGVENITFVDNGKVSYSNPVRQSLYTFKDCQKELSKAETAAGALKEVFPNVKSKGVKLTISMPGRGVNDIDNVAELENLIVEHDVVFLLTDSRESRWLPTLLTAKYKKIAITAALGFDSYLVIRHGMADSSLQLGCYFCNDVTAPGDTSQDRTLDQQCTVTRPGVAHIAASLSVELLVSLLQHPTKGCVDTSSETCLGAVPHSIRGFLYSHTQILPSTPAFSQCTACSSKVIEAYENEGIEFLSKVCLQASYLEDVTGLTELHRATTLTDIMEFSDDEEM